LSTRTLSGPEPPPPEIAEAVEAIRKQIAQALAHERQGKRREAWAMADQALEAATALGYRPVHAEALVQRADLLVGDHTAAACKQAEDQYRKALELADAERYEQLAATIWSRLALLSLRRRAGTQEAREHWRSAATICGGAGDASHQAKLHHLLAEIHFRDGRYAEAAAEEHRAIILISGAADQQVQLSRFYDGLAKALKQLDKVKDALSMHSRAVDLAAGALCPSHPTVIKLKMNHGLTLKKNGQFEDAFTTLDGALRGIPEESRGECLDAGIILGCLSELSYADGKLDEALKHAHASHEIYERIEAPDHRRAEACVNLGNVELKRKNFAAALEMYQKARKLRHELVRSHYQVGVNEGSIAEALIGLSRFDEAMVHLAEARRILASSHDRETQGWILMLRGKALVGRNKLRKAIPLLEQALSLCEKDRDQSNLACTKWTLARALRRKGRSPERVRKLSEEAHALFTQLGIHEARNDDAA
jgi:eukaryotic-like serine/threonine-protein kinase